jgi:hypothetical protein
LGFLCSVEGGLDAARRSRSEKLTRRPRRFVVRAVGIFVFG